MQAVLVSVIFLLLPLIFCLALFDIALRSVNYLKISSVHRHGNDKAKKLFSLLSSPERAISLLLFLRYILTAALFLLCGLFLYGQPIPIVYKLALIPGVLLVALILTEYIPRMLAVQNPERIAFALVGPFQALLTLNRILPFPQISERIASAVLRLFGLNGEKIFSAYSVNEIKMFLSLGRNKMESGLRKQTIDTKFLDFSGRRVREVMVPRPFVKSIEINSPLRNVIRAIQDNQYSRMPVYRNNFDNILGILHARDIIGATEPFSLDQHLKKPFFVPETATVGAAFEHMQRNHTHLAIVVDEYGGVDGIVTLEDLIEELIGEIHDEYDEEIQMLHRINETSWVLDGNLPLKELNRNLNLELPEDPSYTSIAGFLLSILDRIPAENDLVRYGDLQFSIDKMTGHKISRIHLKLPATKDKVVAEKKQ
ncbi:MAG TPA: hemolysin family protein [Acidobacteriota bacterium]|nr:hemolysin family protein [Acidobacteriota bacterium]